MRIVTEGYLPQYVHAATDADTTDMRLSIRHHIGTMRLSDQVDADYMASLIHNMLVRQAYRHTERIQATMNAGTLLQAHAVCLRRRQAKANIRANYEYILQFSIGHLELLCHSPVRRHLPPHWQV